MLKGKYVMQYTLVFHSIQFNSFVKKSDTRKSGYKEAIKNQSYASFSIATHWNRNLGNCGKMKQYVDH